MPNRTRFLAVNIGLGSLIFLGGLYFLGVALLIFIPALSNTYEGVPRLVAFGLSGMMFSIGTVVLYFYVPVLITDYVFLVRYGLPKN
jgi:hypothetical protein